MEAESLLETLEKAGFLGAKQKETIQLRIVKEEEGEPYL